MNKVISDNDLRNAAVNLLHSMGYKVSSQAKGQGVPKYSRIDISKNGKVESCCIKVSNGGRISFTRNPDGSYKVLSDVNFVIHVTPLAGDHAKARVSLFRSSTVLEAFETNFEELKLRKMDHLPIWVNPDAEPAWRVTGSGFIGEAIWSEVVGLNNESKASLETLSPNSDALKETTNDDQKSVMERVKAILAEHMKVKPEFIDIEVRVRF
jgi:hypothetical protein